MKNKLTEIEMLVTPYQRRTKNHVHQNHHDEKSEALTVMHHVPSLAPKRKIKGILSILDQLDRNPNREDRA
jgi:hypothetical protein